MNETPEKPIEWTEISVEIDPVATEALSAFLFGIGCSGIVHKNFNDRSIKAYLPIRDISGDILKKIDDFIRNLAFIFPEVSSPLIRFRKVEELDWAVTWRRFFRPEEVTPNLLVVPAWEPTPDPGKKYVIRTDPGPAFGTGQHSTTRMCLQAMERVTLMNPWNLLDVGTGSGILAIYGIFLGAQNVTAIDIDSEAVRWAERNISINGISGKIDLSCKRIEQLEEKFTLLTANLILDQIKKIFVHLARLTRPQGWLILSGILKEQINQIEDLLDRHGFSHKENMFLEEWACIFAQKGKQY